MHLLRDELSVPEPPRLNLILSRPWSLALRGASGPLKTSPDPRRSLRSARQGQRPARPSPAGGRAPWASPTHRRRQLAALPGPHQHVPPHRGSWSCHLPPATRAAEGEAVPPPTTDTPQRERPGAPPQSPQRPPPVRPARLGQRGGARAREPELRPQPRKGGAGRLSEHAGGRRVRHTGCVCFLTPRSLGGEPAATGCCGCRPPPWAFRGRFGKSMKRPLEVLCTEFYISIGWKASYLQRAGCVSWKSSTLGCACSYGVAGHLQGPPLLARTRSRGEPGATQARGSGTPGWVWYPLLSHYNQKTPNYPV